MAPVDSSPGVTCRKGSAAEASKSTMIQVVGTARCSETGLPESWPGSSEGEQEHWRREQPPAPARLP